MTMEKTIKTRRMRRHGWLAIRRDRHGFWWVLIVVRGGPPLRKKWIRRKQWTDADISQMMENGAI